MSKYLELAKNKFKESNDVNFDLPLIDFVSDCYVRLKPCSYGIRIQQKITTDLSLATIKPQLNIGDVLLGKSTCEVKTSFLDKKNSYHLTHLRMWQKFKFYLFCLIDCDNNFTPEFYLVDKYILNKLKLTPMNGTKESNSENVNIELRTTLKKGSDGYKIINKDNKLGGNTYSDLITYIESINNTKIENVVIPSLDKCGETSGMVDKTLLMEFYQNSEKQIKPGRFKKPMNYIHKMSEHIMVQLLWEDPKYLDETLWDEMFSEVRLFVLSKSLLLKTKNY